MFSNWKVFALNNVTILIDVALCYTCMYPKINYWQVIALSLLLFFSFQNIKLLLQIPADVYNVITMLTNYIY